MKKKNLKNIPILVTGGAGFIGSHLVESLIETGAKIIVPYIEILPNSYFAVNKLKSKVELVKVDLANRKKTDALIRKYKITYIFHLAAQTIVTDALHDPYYTLYNNIVSTINLLETVRNSSFVKGIIIASSDKAYGKTEMTYTEDSPLKGDHPYDVSKSSKDLIAQAYFKTYKVPIVISRFGNIYGEGDLHLSRIIPGICESVLKNKILRIRSNGKYIRDYVYVKDVVSGYLHLLYHLDETMGSAYNFSSHDTLSVIDLVKKIEAITGKNIRYTITNTAVNEIPYQHLQDKKIRKLGWKPMYTLDNTIPGILDWYKIHVFY